MPVMINLFVVLAVVALFTFNSCSLFCVGQTTQSSEANALCDIKANFPNWPGPACASMGWDCTAGATPTATTYPCGTNAVPWSGVGCDSSGSVNSLQLTANCGLAGKLSSDLSVLSGLTILDLRNNKISGSLPGTAIATLTSLTILDLSNNLLGGKIPTSTSKLIKLNTMNLYNNSITSTISTTISKMTSLITLNLYGNLLTKTLPTQISALTALQRLNLHSNKLTSSIPSQISFLTSLTNLQLQNNSFSDQIPSQISMLTKLQSLDLSKNKLGGTAGTFLCIPSIQSGQLQLQKNSFQCVADCAVTLAGPGNYDTITPELATCGASTIAPTPFPTYSYAPTAKPTFNPTVTLPNPPKNPGCLDDSGAPVDFWVALKIPNSAKYFIYDSASSKFVQSPYTLDQYTQGAIMQTVLQIYQFNNKSHPVNYAAYNDQPPDPLAPASSAFAHSKGILMVNETSGFWMIHSVPGWPQTRYQGPSELPDFTYGQSFMCVTVSTATTDIIAKQMMINRPKIYDKIRSQEFYTSLPNFNNLLQNQYTTVPNNSTTRWMSLNGKVFTQFAKAGPQCKRDLWDDFVAPYYKSAINCETWRNGAGGRISSICGANGMKDAQYDVLEVSTVKVGDITWAGSNDHSKWAVANPNYPNGYAATLSQAENRYGDNYLDVATTAARAKGGGEEEEFDSFLSSFTSISEDGIISSNGKVIGSMSNFSCVGDVNRMCSQETRGGGALCTVDSSLWLAFNRTIMSLETCYQYNPCTATSYTAYPTPAPSPSQAPSSQCYWCTYYPPTYIPSYAPSSPTPVVDPTNSAAAAGKLRTTAVIGVSIAGAVVLVISIYIIKRIILSKQKPDDARQSLDATAKAKAKNVDTFENPMLNKDKNRSRAISYEYSVAAAASSTTSTTSSSTNPNPNPGRVASVDDNAEILDTPVFVKAHKNSRSQERLDEL